MAARFLHPLISRRDLIGGAAGGAALAAAGSARAADLAMPAPEWTALFDRRSGWTGADGIYSIPLSGDERPGLSATTFWTFSDSFIGEVGRDGRRKPGSTLINNTHALLQGVAPDPARIRFHWKTAIDGAPRPQVVPDVAERWFWPNDGIVRGERLHLFCLRMKSAPGGDPVFAFAVDGISLLSTDAFADPPFAAYTQVDAPLFAPKQPGRSEISFGLALMPNTEAAGAPNPDGFVYVYGLLNDRSKKLLAARVPLKKLTTFAEYRFWNGSAWTEMLTDAAPLTSRMSSEFSVSPLADGRFILVCQLDTLGAQTAVRYGPSPIGPWSAPTSIYTAPESGSAWTYNAKAHPHLSEPGRLLISYNVNAYNLQDLFRDAALYRPRFLWLPLD